MSEIEVSILSGVSKAIDKLDIVSIDKIDRCLDYLKRSGSNLGMPVSKAIGRGLFELRIMGDVDIRILYCFHKNKAYILHILKKKAKKLPRKDLDLARKIMSQIVQI